MSTRVEADPESLRRLLKAFRELPKEVKTGVRRELRTVGDDVIRGQREILDGPLPSGVTVTGQRFGRGMRGGRSTGLREGIKKGLKTRIVAGKTRVGIDIRTNTRRAPMSTGWNAKRFRHPTFGRAPWVYQAGQPYFYPPVIEGRDDMIIRATRVLNKAIEEA